MEKPDFASLLRKKGLRVTSGRLALLTLLWEEAAPLSVQALLQKLTKPPDVATAYRALELFAALSLIRRVDLGHGHSHYEFERTHHHHIICTSCGKVEDVEDGATEKHLQNMAGRSKLFKSIYSHTVEFFGNCQNCNN